MLNWEKVTVPLYITKKENFPSICFHAYLLLSQSPVTSSVWGILDARIILKIYENKNYSWWKISSLFCCLCHLSFCLTCSLGHLGSDKNLWEELSSYPDRSHLENPNCSCVQTAPDTDCWQVPCATNSVTLWSCWLVQLLFNFYFHQMYVSDCHIQAYSFVFYISKLAF